MEKLIVACALAGWLVGYIAGLLQWRREFDEWDFITPVMAGIAMSLTFGLMGAAIFFLAFA